MSCIELERMKYMVRGNEAKKNTIGLEWTSDMISMKKTKVCAEWNKRTKMLIRMKKMKERYDQNKTKNVTKFI